MANTGDPFDEATPLLRPASVVPSTAQPQTSSSGKTVSVVTFKFPNDPTSADHQGLLFSSKNHTKIVYLSAESISTQQYPEQRFPNLAQKQTLKLERGMRETDPSKVTIVNTHSFAKVVAGKVMDLIKSLEGVSYGALVSAVKKIPFSIAPLDENNMVELSRPLTAMEVAIANSHAENEFVGLAVKKLSMQSSVEVDDTVAGSIIATAETRKVKAASLGEFQYSNVYYVKDNWSNTMHMGSLVCEEVHEFGTVVTRRKYDGTPVPGGLSFKTSGLDASSVTGVVPLLMGGQITDDEISAAGSEIIASYEPSMVGFVPDDKHFVLDVVDRLAKNVNGKPGRSEDADGLAIGVQSLYAQMRFMERLELQTRDRDHVGKPPLLQQKKLKETSSANERQEQRTPAVGAW